MQLSIVVLSALFAATSAYPTVLVATAPAVIPAGLRTQYHAQDELGQYTYGYTDGLSAKSEAKTIDGVTRGAYSYVDSAGLVQNVNYVSDAAGFRVAASNLPVAPVPVPAVLPVAPLPVQDTPEVAAAKAAHLNEVKEAEINSAAAPEEPKTDEESNESSDESGTSAPVDAVPAEAAPAPENEAESKPAVETPAASPVLISPASPAVLATQPIAPVLVSHAPIAPIAPVAPIAPIAPIVPIAYTPQIIAAPAPVIGSPIASQYHSQDELGQYSYGYTGGPSAKAELKTVDGVTRGGYSYLDANGLIQSTNYVSDPVNGFRVAASNLPIAAVPVHIPDSVEVAEAKAKHLALVEKAAAEAAAKPE